MENTALKEHQEMVIINLGALGLISLSLSTDVEKKAFIHGRHLFFRLEKTSK